MPFETYHVRISGSFDLENSMLPREIIKGLVQSVKEARNFDRRERAEKRERRNGKG